MLVASKVKPQTVDRLEFPHPGVPPTGATLEIAPGICWLRIPLPFALEPINLWLLADGAGWAIVGRAFGGHEARAIWREIGSDGVYLFARACAI